MPPKESKPPRAPRLKPAPPSLRAEKAWPPAATDARKPFQGYSFAFFGEFAIWPSYHGGTPVEVAARRGADVRAKVDADLDCVVFGDRRGAGRADAKKRAAKLEAAGVPIHVLDEGAFRDLVRIDLTGKQFFFVGGFDCSPAGVEDGLLARMVQRAGGVVAAEVSAALDYLVVGNRQGPSKVAIQNKAKKLCEEEGASIAKLSESAFLELVRVDDAPAENASANASGGELDFAGFLSQLYGRVNEGKLGRALAMLRADRHQLFSSKDEQRLVGVVKSQSGSGTVYASWLAPNGGYGCATADLAPCMGLQGSPCKHLLVLVVGLARAGELGMPLALEWMRATSGKSPKEDEELSAGTFIRYKGAEAGEIDWRPTETMPEDFYAV